MSSQFNFLFYEDDITLDLVQNIMTEFYFLEWESCTCMSRCATAVSPLNVTISWLSIPTARETDSDSLMLPSHRQRTLRTVSHTCKRVITIRRSLCTSCSLQATIMTHIDTYKYIHRHQIFKLQ
jgi:hypothetical protein